ncbi:hypothetical protein BGZ95_005729 [Linnemannia exigua]|uniref:Metallo-beta-lactamase domain-containing protein n=1 Tax=Linnemannia exigua TaxID=604196 RepID=A0AAD4DGZ2_9FUNG|nr:hypothetical protein BGZ95_005729 [Linnemannia exigua]
MSPVSSFVCATCGVNAPAGPSGKPQEFCIICDEPRQYVRQGGQEWTTLEEMKSSGKYTNVFTPTEADPENMIDSTTPPYAIGQRGILIKTPKGNILWDCITPIDDDTVRKIKKEHGGLKAIVISHPYCYSSLKDWSEAFGGIPVYTHASDRQWVQRPADNHIFWEEIKVLCPGGHFDGASLLLWNKNLLIADTVIFAASRKSATFMYSFPNYWPLGPNGVQTIWKTVCPYEINNLLSAWADGEIVGNGRNIIFNKQHARRQASNNVKLLQRGSPLANSPTRTDLAFDVQEFANSPLQQLGLSGHFQYELVVPPLLPFLGELTTLEMRLRGMAQFQMRMALTACPLLEKIHFESREVLFLRVLEKDVKHLSPLRIQSLVLLSVHLHQFALDDDLLSKSPNLKDLKLHILKRDSDKPTVFASNKFNDVERARLDNNSARKGTDLEGSRAPLSLASSSDISPKYVRKSEICSSMALASVAVDTRMDSQLKNLGLLEDLKTMLLEEMEASDFDLWPRLTKLGLYNDADAWSSVDREYHRLTEDHVLAHRSRLSQMFSFYSK